MIIPGNIIAQNREDSVFPYLFRKTEGSCKNGVKSTSFFTTPHKYKIWNNYNRQTGKRSNTIRQA